MDNRSVLQQDKDDCAETGLVKFDFLDLGALATLCLAFTMLVQREQAVPDAVTEEELCTFQSGRPWRLRTLPEEDPTVYRLLTAADMAGAFQVESRIQMAAPLRLRPQIFCDIVIGVALIRPGPIQGDVASPYIRRRLRREEVIYPRDSLKPTLIKTPGVPLPQEQLMQIAIGTVGFSPAETDSLCQAMRAKRSIKYMDTLHDKLTAGTESRGTGKPTTETTYSKLRSSAELGFSESRTFSLTYLVYASVWLKVHKPEGFYAGVLAVQPVGFWSPQLLVADTRRHGVRVLLADVNRSLMQAIAEQQEDRQGAGPSDQWEPLRPHPAVPPSLDIHDDLTVCLGLAPTKGLGERAAQAIVTKRRTHSPYRDLTDLVRRASLSRSHPESLAVSEVLDNLGAEHHQALRAAGILSDEHGRRRGASRQGPGVWCQPTSPGIATDSQAPTLPAMTDYERRAADLSLAGVPTQGLPLRLLRAPLTADDVLSVADLADQEHGSWVRVAGVVTH